MRKRTWFVRLLAVQAVVVGLIGVRCGSSPIGPSSATPQHSQLSATSASTDSLDIGGGGAFPTWNVGGAQGDFRVHPTQGAPPLTVHVNMCHATDPAPGITLHYHVTWGDGSDDHGFCRFEHVYPDAGVFEAKACVWDEIPAHAPGDCLTVTFTANSSATRTPTPVPTPNPLCHSIVAASPTVVGGSVACPTGAAQFCQSTSIVATSSAQAKAACETCFGAGKCFPALATFSSCNNTLSAWIGNPAAPAGFTDYVYSSSLAGDILDGHGCFVSRWAP